MALGYVIGTVVERSTKRIANADVVLKIDRIESLGAYVQLQGKDREKLREIGKTLELEGNYVPRSYIELVCIIILTQLATQKYFLLDVRNTFQLIFLFGNFRQSVNVICNSKYIYIYIPRRIHFIMRYCAGAIREADERVAAENGS